MDDDDLAEGVADSGPGDLYRGFGESLSRAFEMALTPAILGGLGNLLDRWLGTGLVLTLGLFLFAVAGMFLRMWYGYDARMKVLEAAAPWARSATRR